MVLVLVSALSVLRQWFRRLEFEVTIVAAADVAFETAEAAFAGALETVFATFLILFAMDGWSACCHALRVGLVTLRDPLRKYPDPVMFVYLPQ